MNLLTVIIQSLGPGSAPFVVAGSVLGVFELGERLASQRAKDALSKWLVSFDVQKAKALPEGTQELLERIFGERHFSLKCFIRSAAFSLGAIAFISLLVLLIVPQGSVSQGFASHPWGIEAILFVGLWLFWSIIFDYFSLFKTRVILRIMTLAKLRPLIAMAIFGCGFFYLFCNVPRWTHLGGWSYIRCNK